MAVAFIQLLEAGEKGPCLCIGSMAPLSIYSKLNFEPDFHHLCTPLPRSKNNGAVLRTCYCIFLCDYTHPHQNQFRVVLFSKFLAVLALSESLMYHLAGSLNACQCLTLHFCSGFKAESAAELKSFLWMLIEM